MKRRDFVRLLGGATVGWPLVAHAQDHAFPVVGFLHPGSPQRNADLVAAFRQGLGETGYIEGRNVAIEYFWGDDRFDRMPGFAAELIRRPVAVIVVTSTAAVLAVARATSKIPVIANFASDAVGLGLVASLNRPGGNVTGINFLSGELAPKQLELLHKLVPAASTMALLVNPANSKLAETLSRDVSAAARARGLQLRIVHASTEPEVGEAFASLVQRVEGLLIGPDTLFNGRSEWVAALAIRHAVPAIYQFREFAAAGGLMSYGTIHTDSYRESGLYAGNILGGVNPGDLPVKQPNRFELVINLKTARALGLDVPRQLLVRADEVIE
jgi:putative tryptophan/tyrosine transport system substrate-binding protein